MPRPRKVQPYVPPEPMRAWQPEGHAPDVTVGHGTLPEEPVADEMPDEPQDMSTEKLAAMRDATEAAEVAIEADKEAAEAAEYATALAAVAEDVDQPKAKRCRVCGTRMHHHNNPEDLTKYGFYHCTTCGTCGPVSY